MGFIVRRDGCRLWCASIFSEFDGLVHGVSTRDGGVSRPPFHSLNIGLHVGDLREDVLSNRAILLKSLGYSSADAVCAEQVHGIRVQEVTADDAGRGSFDYEETVPGVDALITAARGVVLMGYFADCTPVFFVDSQKKWIGLAHAGWRGTLHGISRRVIEQFQDRGVHPRDLYVALGPHIGPCCYEVGDDVADAFSSHFGPDVVRKLSSGRRAVNLAAANATLLEGAGVKNNRIEICDECTACQSERYFSHRVDGPSTGRMAAVIALSR